MAAVSITTGTARVENWGDTMAFHVDITSVDDADTFDAGAQGGFGVIDNAFFTPTTAVVAVPTFSGTTITFKVASGSVAGRLTIVGR